MTGPPRAPEPHAVPDPLQPQPVPESFQPREPGEPVPAPWARGSRRYGQPRWFGRPHRFTRSVRLVPLAAGVAVTLSSSALAGVLQGFRWFWFAALVVGVVVVLGMVMRAVRLPTVFVVVGQLAGLTMLVTGLFSGEAVLGVFPGPDALRELGGTMSIAISVIENGIPPVATSPAMGLLVAVVFGLVAVATDALAVAGDGPAACGLVLLGVYTVATALTPLPLPAWTLAAGAGGFALVLLAEHRRRQARRGVSTGPPPGTGSRPSGTGTTGTGTTGIGATGIGATGIGATGIGATGTANPARQLLDRLRAGRVGGTDAPLAAALTAVALAAALGLGLVFTVIGTEGRFTHNGRGPSDGENGQFGLNPFTSLRGQLDRDEPSELMRVRGLAEPRYLRALTLNRYVPQQGWQLPGRQNGVNLDDTLPSGLPFPVQNATANVSVENIRYRDQWLPLVGLPMGVTGVLPGRWRYDVSSGTAFADAPVREPAWVERAALPEPDVRALQNIGLASDVNPTYLDTGGVDPRIGALTAGVVKQARTPFERVIAINKYFLDPENGFRYSLTTRPGNTGDALLDFLIRGKAGYCEQFASAMAVMLRTVGIPSRVAVGFTPGNQVDDYRSISTADAHAWVEAYFAGVGWLTFDPTPLRDGRSVEPDYVSDAPDVPVEPPSPAELGPAPNLGQDSRAQAAPPPPPPGGPGPEQPTPQPDPNAAQQAAPQPASPDPAQQGQALPAPTEVGEGEQETGSEPGGPEDGAGGGQNDEDPTSGIEQLSPIARLLLLIGVVLLLTVLLAAAPAAARGLVRRHRLARINSGGPGAADAAWRELLAEFADRGGRPAAIGAENGTVRMTARRLARATKLDGDAVQGVKTVVGAVERGWYAERADPGPGSTLVAAVDSVRAGLDRSAPLGLAGRLWPRSVRPRVRR